MAPHPVGRAWIELPAALLVDTGEDPLAAARRVLTDAAGIAAGTWNTLLDLPAFSGGLDEPSRVYLARDLNPGTAGKPGSSWIALDEAVDDVFADVIGNRVAAAAIVATAHARHTAWHPLQPADPPGFHLGSTEPDEHAT
jgi:8-oxo-dGDP phosphatase